MSAFIPTSDWQPVPDGAVLPPGLQVEIDVTTGQKRARLAPSTDAAAVAAFLDHWHENRAPQATLVSIHPESGATHAASFDWSSERERLLQWVAAVNRSCNCYFAVNPANAVGRKPRKSDLTHLAAAHADVDPQGGLPLTDERQRLLALAGELPMRENPPSFVVDSGGGIQAFYTLAEPCPVDGAPEFVEELEALNRRLEAVLGGKGTHNADRIMRLPGTVNWPDAKKRAKGRAPAVARVLSASRRTYTWREIADAVARLEDEPPANAVPHPHGERQRVNGHDVDLGTDLPLPASEAEVEALCQNFPHIGAIWRKTSAPPPDATQSGWDYHLVGRLARLGFGRDKIAAFLRAFCERHDGASGNADKAPYVWRTINAATARNSQSRGNSTAPRPGLRIADWSAPGAYAGAVPEQRWLVADTLPLGIPALLAAAGGLGKSNLLLDLCWHVAAGHAGAPILGGAIAATGAAVMLTGEDAKSTVHRRLAYRAHLKPCGQPLVIERAELPPDLYVVPLPDAGGPRSLVAGNRFDGLAASDDYADILAQLKAIPDLRLIVLDPLQMFTANADITADPAGAQRVCSLLARIAAETGATVIAAHHFRKPSTSQKIVTAADARNAVRGTTGLVDGVRLAYALWESEDEADAEICRRLTTAPPLVRGAVVKSNSTATGGLHAYLRRADGRLEDVTELANRMTADLRTHGLAPDQMDELVQAIGRQAEAGRPLTRTGANGAYARRESLPLFAHKIGKHKLAGIVDGLLAEGRLVQALAAGSKQAQWLDLPDGPFARGQGAFKEGAQP